MIVVPTDFKPIIRSSSKELEEILGLSLPMLDHGYLKAVDFMGSEQEIVNAARISYGKGTKSTSDDINLLRYLIRHHHNTPLEMAVIKFEMQMPIFVARQFIRHRTACLSGDTILGFGNIKDGGAKPKTVKQIHDMWHQKATQVSGAKKKTTFVEIVNANKYYSVPELAELVGRREENIQNYIRWGKIEANENPNAAPHEPKYSVKGSAYHTWANAVFERPINDMKDTIKRMKLRMLDEEQGIVDYTSITDIWESGKKVVYQITLDTGQVMSGLSKDHLCYTDQGWLKLKDFVDLKTGDTTAKMCSILPRGKNPWKLNSKAITINKKQEKWKWIEGLEGDYKVSNFGRVKSYKWNKISVKTPTITEQGYTLFSFQLKDGSQMTEFGHVLVAKTWVAKQPKRKPFVRHNNGNRQDNRPENLFWASSKENAKNTIKHENTTKLQAKFVDILSIKNLGVQMTYDLSVAGPYHNFVADGVIVHNSVNEYSARYSEMPELFYIPQPENLGLQSTTNKQGKSDVPIDNTKLVNYFLEIIHENDDAAFSRYQEMLAANISREQARIVLPLNIYTKWVWKTDCNNLLKFLKLREDSHAQYEIRVYAEGMAKILEIWMPNVHTAYIDYIKEAVHLSKQQFEMVNRMMLSFSDSHPTDIYKEFSALRPTGMSKREFDELVSLFKLNTEKYND